MMREPIIRFGLLFTAAGCDCFLKRFAVVVSVLKF